MNCDERIRVCAFGNCSYTLPAWSDGISDFPESIKPPNAVTGDDLVCDSCVIAKLGLDSCITYFSDDRMGLTEIVPEDDVDDAFKRLGYGVTADVIAGGYDVEDTLSMTRYCYLAEVVTFVRGLDLGV